jgi:TolB-like protein/DNA-binding winged helix-turn-helix (wHTH) protein
MRDVPEAGGLKLPGEASSPVRFAGLVLDLDACTLARESGEEIPLTRGELALLRVFVTRPGRVISRDTLLDALANRRFEPFDRSVDVLVGRLRRKIEPDLKEPRLIVTVPGEGYRFDGLAKPPPSDQRLSPTVSAPRNNERTEPDRGSPAPSEKSAEGELAADAKPAQQATVTDRAKPPASQPRFGAGPLAAAVAALVLITVGGWFLLGGRLTNPPRAPHLSIVVLPFANLSGDPAQDYFVDGVTENLTTQLSRISDSLVIARNTAFAYKGRNVDAKEIGKALGVRYALEGSVERDQGRLRVNAELIDTETGAHLWADVFDEEVADLLKAQDQVVARLARALGPELVRAEAGKASSKNPDAVDLAIRGWDLVLRANRLPSEDKRETFHQARGLFDRALEINPNDPLAVAGSAETYLVDYGFGWRDPGTDYEARVLGQANRAIVLAPDNIPAYYTKAMYLAETARPSQALDVTDAGLAINPNDVLLYLPRAQAENALGRFEQARADAERAMWLSPRDFLNGVFHMIAGDAEINLGDFDAAIDAYRKTLDSGFREFFIYARLSAAYADAGRIDEAKTALAEARRLNPNFTVKSMIEHMPNWPAVFEGVRRAGLPGE